MKKEIYILKELHQLVDDAPYCHVYLYPTLEDAKQGMKEKFNKKQDEWKEVDEDCGATTANPYYFGDIYEVSATLSDGCGYYIDWCIDVQEIEI